MSTLKSTPNFHAKIDAEGVEPRAPWLRDHCASSQKQILRVLVTVLVTQVARTCVLDEGRQPVQEDVADELGEEQAQRELHHALECQSAAPFTKLTLISLTSQCLFPDPILGISTYSIKMPMASKMIIKLFSSDLYSSISIGPTYQL